MTRSSDKPGAGAAAADVATADGVIAGLVVECRGS
jgi:hypothetical protein